MQMSNKYLYFIEFLIYNDQWWGLYLQRFSAVLWTRIFRQKIWQLEHFQLLFKQINFVKKYDEGSLAEKDTV